MNKISPLDIRIAVVAHPLVTKEDRAKAAFAQRPIVPFSGDERIVSLFQNSPKPRIEPSKSKVPPLVRKAHYILIRLLEILKAFLAENPPSTLLADVAPPRRLLVPQLPHPPFRAPKPARFFWHPAYVSPSDEYAPSCLMSETKEDLPTTVYNSAAICAYARSALTQKGILRQDEKGFVYLELSEAFIRDLFPLIADDVYEAIPVHIPVILPHEAAQKKGWGEIGELEESFAFRIQRLCQLKPKRWPGVEKVYFLSISSPELERLRERCLLPSRIRGHQFHVAIAYKKERSQGVEETEIFRLNVSCFAA